MMIDTNIQDIDEVMTGIGMRVANEVVGKPLGDDDIDDLLINSLKKASDTQLYDVVDNMIDFLSISEILNHALSDDGVLDEEELDELMAYVEHLEGDTKILIKSLLN